MTVEQSSWQNLKKMVEEDYGIIRKPITKRNPRANSMIERIHQTIENMIRTFEVQEALLDEEDLWTGMLTAVMFATRATYHTTLKATPMQLVFGQDAVLNTEFEADWQLIQQNKQKIIYQNNQRENAKRIAHTYQIGDKVLFKEIEDNKYGNNPYSGPHIVRKVHPNGTVVVKMGSVLETINICLIKSYKD